MQRYAPDALAKHWPLDLPYIIKSRRLGMPPVFPILLECTLVSPM